MKKSAGGTVEIKQMFALREEWNERHTHTHTHRGDRDVKKSAGGTVTLIRCML